ncbi:hypothetical protein LAZ67_13000383 [Cordylochernes scorpioides]|uniref:Uncharacterized protein n=1 Tax=Cordylochernes scorpioides TaxID=51811 RepID=A0ABY6L6U6_9ARAC|nr:hypothetical protein LAZ67_13000383 [Cordylochernes scorpioides]
MGLVKSSEIFKNSTPLPCCLQALDGIGTMLADLKKCQMARVGVTRPPGGECSDIFGVDHTDGLHMSKTNGASPPPPLQNGQRRLSDTQNRLFGPPETSATPRRSSAVNRMKSSIFAGESNSAPPSRTPSAKKSLGPMRRNPITGEVLAAESPVPNGCNGHSCPATPGTWGDRLLGAGT